jgi:hypothetical protein
MTYEQAVSVRFSAVRPDWGTPVYTLLFYYLLTPTISDAFLAPITISVSNTV